MGALRLEGLRRRATPVAFAILLTGAIVSVAGGLWWRSSVQGEHKKAFERTASDVTTTLGAMLRRDADFVTTLRAIMSMQPQMSASRFDRWFAELNGHDRQVGGLGTSIIDRVPAGELSSFLARRDVDPAFRRLIGGTPERVRAGADPSCLLAAGVSESGGLGSAVAHVLQGNWCEPSSPIGISQAVAMRAQANTGEMLVVPVTAQGVETMFFQSAFYRANAPRRSAAQRRRALSGWISSSFDVPAVVRAAMNGQRGLGVALYHANPGQPVELVDRVGVVTHTDSPRYRARFQIDGSWALVVSQSAVASALSPELQGLLVTLVGIAVSGLLFALVLVLARSREHALGMVRAKTGELRHQALHDALTGLPNRLLALDRAGQMLARAARAQRPMAALYVDLDGFKHVNDTFGHAAGDELLRAVAARLETILRDGDTAARLGGDEFVVLLEAGDLDAGPELVAERLLELLRRPYEVPRAHGRCLSLTASIGIALALDGTADELLHAADLALYRAKTAGRDQSVVFRSEMETASRDRLTLEMDLADALERERQLFLEYQPIVDLHSERIVGVEALIRWRHPTRGVLSPCEFIPLAEETGQIVPIGRWALREATRQAAQWARAGHELGVAVNVSARQLDAAELVGDVRRALAESGLRPGALTLEITETALMRDARAAVQRLRTLKRLGVCIAIDDFGTGYSSLAYLRQFPADSLKIDRSFVAGVASSRDSAALIETLVQLGSSLGIKTLAEGIEDTAQLRALQRAGCDLGQGFLFSRPVCAETVAGLLCEEHGRPQAAAGEPRSGAALALSAH
jgi:diguanylate cyclase (GGDEF)-like protein